MMENKRDIRSRNSSATGTVRSRCASTRFGVRVAFVPFGYDGTDLLTLLRKKLKQKAWTLITEVPFLDESLDDAAMRLFKNYLPEKQSSLDQIYAFGESHFVRTRWITIVYSAVIHLANGDKKQRTTSAEWFAVNRRPLLTRHEDQMIDAAIRALQTKVRYEPIGIYLLPPEFTLQQLQKMYELVLGQPISRETFRKKMWESEILIPLEETVTEIGRSQPKGLYRFNEKKYNELKRKGFFLDL
jgi:ADP-ribose pyrophosphatase YjhB (NUDIX family)